MLLHRAEVFVSSIGFVFPVFTSFAFLQWYNITNIPFAAISIFVISALTIISALIFLTLYYKSPALLIRHWTFSVAWRSSLLGGIFVFGLFLSCNEPVPSWRPFGLYLCILSFFHWSEYVATALWNRETLNLSSFLLDHSVDYWAAAASSWVEFSVENYFFPGMKSFLVVSWIGVMLCIVGEVFRKLAMFTAGHNFTHIIQYRKRGHHRLITHGIYSLFRHPSYVGWFWWSVGTQITLCNPICLVLYAVISWRFFNERIYYEEITLINFFGEYYVDYQKRVPTGLPGIVGFQPDA